MRLLDHFQRLAEWYPGASTPDLAQIAAALCCSERNTRLLLRRMQEQGWIDWQPGNGRGHRSRLNLLQDHENLRLQRLHHLLADGKLEAAFDGLPSAGRERLKQSLPGYLGSGRAGTLRMPFYRPLHALDAIHINRRTEQHIIMQICAGLTEYDRTSEQIIPALAHRWDASADGSSWEFTLRPGLHFHDGRTVRAEDVVYTLQRARDSDGPYRAMFAHLASITGTERSVKLQLNKPDHLLLHLLAHHAAVIVPMDDDKRTDFATLPIGAGPFRLLRNNEHRATLAAFDGYFRERALPDEIDLWVVPHGSPLPEVDLHLAHASPDQVPAPDDSWSRIRALEQGCDMVMLNPARAEFSTPAARLAIGNWLRPAAAELAAKETRPMAFGMLPQWNHLPEKKTTKAPALPAHLDVVTYELDSHIALTHCVAARLREAGADVTIHILPFPEFGPYGWRDWADVVIAGDVLDNDMEFGLYSWLAGESLVKQMMDKTARTWLAQASADIAAEADAAQRAHLIETCFARIVQEAWILPMRHTRHGIDYGPQLGGVTLARCGWMDFRKLWLRPGSN